MTHIVIPMSGLGERFIKAGYASPKPVIEVDGRPIIEHVVAMFNTNFDEKNKDSSLHFTFICNEEHLALPGFRETLERVAPLSPIISLPVHRKGPVWAVLQALQKDSFLIDDNEETIVNYCDFYSYWNFADFLKVVRGQNSAGAIAAYRNFHPHMLGSDNYAFIKDRDGWMEAIQEKKPFTSNRMAEFASNGTYYFARGEYVKKYFAALVEQNISVGGEFYVSMVYNLMVADKLPVFVYEVEHMLQWGTPRDLEEYQHWSDYFTSLARQAASRGPLKVPRPGSTAGSINVPRPALSGQQVDVTLIPMAGKGSRFVEVGYLTPKPLIPVSNQPMVVLAADNLPPAARYVFVAQKEHLDNSQLKGILTESFDEVCVVVLDGMTEGQASTCQIGIERAVPAIAGGDSLLIGACDNGIIYDQQRWQALLADLSIDVAAFSFRNHPASERNPHMFGWLKVTANENVVFPVIEDVSVKKAISDNPRNDHAIVGAFFFRQADYFKEAMEVMIRDNVRVNGEFYVDSMIGVLAKAGRKCVAFEVDDYISFGIPNDLKTFEYWQSFFHKCSWHSYSREVIGA